MGGQIKKELPHMNIRKYGFGHEKKGVPEWCKARPKIDYKLSTKNERKTENLGLGQGLKILSPRDTLTYKKKKSVGRKNPKNDKERTKLLVSGENKPKSGIFLVTKISHQTSKNHWGNKHKNTQKNPQILRN